MNSNTIDSSTLFIDRIELRNFRNHKYLDVTFSKLNILIGDNGAGKSSILEAICYGLFGSTANANKKSELLNYGSKNGSVTLYLSNGYKIVRDLKSSSKLLDEKDRVISEKNSDIEYYLNMDKNVFMNILYASQDNLYSYFSKFNAKEKDFIDSLFNLDTLTDKILLFLKNSIVELNMRYNDIQSTINTKNGLEESIYNLLRSYGMDSIENLERSVEIARLNFQDLNNKNMLYQQRENIKRKLDSNKSILLSINNKIKELEENTNDTNKLERVKQDFLDYIHNIERDLNVTIDIKNIQPLFTMFDNNTNITNHLNYIKDCSEEGLNDLNDKDKVEKCFKIISSEVDTIGILDNYRSYYQDIKNTISNLTHKIEIEVNNLNYNSNTLASEKVELDRVVREIRKLEEELSKLDINDIGNIEEFTNIVMQNQARYTRLKTTLDNIKVYKQQLDNLVLKGSVEDLNRITSTITSIEKIIPLFHRDGFVSYLRNSLLKEIAESIGDSLEKFVFTNLTPVSIDEKSGSLLFHDRPFHSLSGGEKSVASIILRIIYSKLLLPSMKLNILMLDEPNSALDSTRISYLRELFSKISSSLNMQLIIVCHDSEMIPESANTILIGG